jgi:hypothetical protein
VWDLQGTLRGVLGQNGAFSEFGTGGGHRLPLATDAKRTKKPKIEKVLVAANASVDLVNITGESGVLSNLWVVFSTMAGGRDGDIFIYVDGEATPSLSMQCHHFGTLWQPQAASRFQHKYMGCSLIIDTVPKHGLKFNYPVPYSTSVRVVYRAPATAVEVFGNYTLHKGPDMPYRLKFKGLRYQNAMVGVTADQLYNRSVKFLDLPSGVGNRGWIVGAMFGMYNSRDDVANPMSYLENNPVVYQGNQPRDGSVAPDYDSSGWEDELRNLYYFGNGLGSWDDMYISSRQQAGNGNNITAVIDYLNPLGGIYFDDGCLFTVERGLAASPGNSTATIDMRYGVWYYVPKT